MVELKLLLVESVNGLHVLHAFLEDLHFLLELDLLLGLIIGILASQIFELLGVVLFVLCALLLEVFLELSVIFEQVLDLIFIGLEDVDALLLESSLDIVRLVRVVSAHLAELELHGGDQKIDVIVLLLERIHILIVFALELLKELPDKFLLLLNDESTSLFLELDFLQANGYATYM